MDAEIWVSIENIVFFIVLGIVAIIALKNMG